MPHESRAAAPTPPLSPPPPPTTRQTDSLTGLSPPKVEHTGPPGAMECPGAAPLASVEDVGALVDRLGTVSLGLLDGVDEAEDAGLYQVTW